MKTPSLTSQSVESFLLFCNCRRTCAAALLCGCLSLRLVGLGQVTIMDNFNSGIDPAWAHYAPLQTAPWNENVSWTFPADPAGGRSYRIFGGVPAIAYDPATANNTGPARVGSFRNDAAYADFSAAADL